MRKLQVVFAAQQNQKSTTTTIQPGTSSCTLESHLQTVWTKYQRVAESANAPSIIHSSHICIQRNPKMEHSVLMHGLALPSLPLTLVGTVHIAGLIMSKIKYLINPSVRTTQIGVKFGPVMGMSSAAQSSTHDYFS